MKYIAVVLSILLFTSCTKKSEVEVLPVQDFLVKTEKRTVFDQKSSKTYLTNFTYDEDGSLLSAINDELSISYQKNENNLGSLTNAYVVSVESRADAEITRQYFCDESKRVLKETASDGVEKYYSYNQDGFLQQAVTMHQNGLPSDTLDFTYNTRNNNPQAIVDVIATNFKVEKPAGKWNFIGKTYTFYQYMKDRREAKGVLEYPFNFGRKRAEQLSKTIKSPYFEGIPLESFHSYTLDENDYLLESKILSSGKYTEIVSYTYVQK